MEQFIAMGAQGWDGQSPRFLIIQAQPWQNVTPTSYANVAATLGTDYVVVRPDHIFELIREANGLPINPVHQYAIKASTDRNGDITPSGTVTLNQNVDQTFTFTPHAGHSVASVSVDGVAAPVGSPSPSATPSCGRTHKLTCRGHWRAVNCGKPSCGHGQVLRIVRPTP